MPRSSEPSLVSTATLMSRLQDGDEGAQQQLIERCLPALRRWAHGRLPTYARDLADTGDLVQTTLLRTVQKLPSLERRATGSFLAYMRQVLLNEVRDQIRRQKRRPRHESMQTPTGEERDVPVAAGDPTVLAAYERALGDLSEAQREAVVLRVEFGMTFPEIALELGLSSAGAARMRVARGLAEMAERFSP